MASFLLRIFKRTPKSVLGRLEELENEILNLESKRCSNIDSEKRFVFRLLLYSFIIFGVGFIVVYGYFWPSTQIGKLMLWTSVLIYPVLVSLLRWAFRTFFFRQVAKTDERLKLLREEKQRMLEEVMENEKFNKAQQILKRFDPLMFARLSAMEHTPQPQTPATVRKPMDTGTSVVRNRNQRGPDGDSMSHAPMTPLRRADVKAASSVDLKGSEQASAQGPAQQTAEKQPRLLRPILPRERSLFDRLVDALVGDGPDKRYALICRECASHNGMALQEEFEYLAFRCCYCSHFNPPRRPRLKPSIPPNIAPTPKLRSAFSCEQLSTSTPRSTTSTVEQLPARKRSPSLSESTVTLNSVTEVEEVFSDQTVTEPHSAS